MMTEADFNHLVAQIMALGYDEQTAADFATRIGDTPALDANGYTVIRDDAGQVRAKLRLEWE